MAHAGHLVTGALSLPHRSTLVASGHVPLHMAVSPSSGVSQPARPGHCSELDVLTLGVVTTNSCLSCSSVALCWVTAWSDL